MLLSQETNSRIIDSSQTGCHQQLAAVVRRHLAKPFRKPIASHNRAAFDQAHHWLEQHPGPLILDSFCGTGESSLTLARQFPDHRVIGIDKSAHRLAKHSAPEAENRPSNYLLVRADTDDFWRLAVSAGWQPQHHYLLYPNPWPKPAQLQRRCHGSPLFPTLLALGGQLELRSNWKIYVEEFVQALQIAGEQASFEHFKPSDPITAFERKYTASGHLLWRAAAQLSSKRPKTL